MSILKDASASAIYGARAANGVVLLPPNEVPLKIKPESRILAMGVCKILPAPTRC
jgi:TonB-dependent SusC/RagA subfamily outer membrane receptor